MLDDRVMPIESEVVRDVCEDRGVPAKALAMRLGVNRSTVYRYFSGELNVTPPVLKALWDMTADKRLIELITGPIAIGSAVLTLAADATSPAKTPPRIPPAGQLISELSEAGKALLDMMPLVERILADGRIDHGDRALIAKYHERSAALNTRCAMVGASLDSQLNRSMRATNNGSH